MSISKKKIGKDERILAKNTIFSFLHSYGSFILSIATSFLIARLITKEIWDFFIIALSYITLFTALLIFFPPSIGQSLNYYIPRYLILKQNSKLKSFISKCFIIRLMFVLIIFIISLLIFTSFLELFQLNLHDYINLLYLLAPLIIIKGLYPVLVEIYRGLNMFNTVFILLIIRYSVNIGGLIYLFFFIDSVFIEDIAIITLLSALIQFLSSFIIIIFVLLKIEGNEEQGLSFNQVFILILKYSSYLSIKDFLSNFSREFKTQLVSFVGAPGTVIGYNIATNYSSVSHNLLNSLNKPLTISFSSLDVKNKKDQIQQIYRVFLYYTIFLLLLITGILFFMVDIFLFLIYTEDFLEFSVILKLMLLSIVFSVMLPFFFSLLKASNKVNYVLFTSVLNIAINILFFLLGLFLFGITGAIIGLLIANLIVFIFFSILSHPIFNIKLNIKRIVLIYINFFLALGISLVLAELIISDLNFQILQILHLTFLKNFEFLTLLTFLIIFFLMTIVMKIFTVDDIKNIEALFNKNNIIHRLIRRGLKVLKKVILD